MKTTKEELEHWDTILDEYEQGMGLPNYITEGLPAEELNEYLTMSRDVLEKVTPDQCGEIAYRLSQFAFHVQRTINREIARYNWSDDKIKEVIADEINRAPSKVQSALLECMQEKQVTISEDTFTLESPFVVIATQNPLEQEGTYPLPEAQLDRFMMKLKVDYPSKKEEKEILNRAAKTSKVEDVKKTVKTKNIIDAQKLIDEIYVDEKVEEYVLDLVFATRQPKNYGLDDLSQLIKIGASPRASINLILAAKAKAFIERRGYVIPEDVRYIGKDVLCHRLSLTYEAEAEELLEEDIVQRLFETIEIP